MKNIIHIFGASGSGTTTLAKKICSELGFFHMDTDDYFWVPTNPMYTQKRPPEERILMMKRDIASADNVVISGSLVGWGDQLIQSFTLAVRLKTDTDIRIERIKHREKKKFGERIEFGGDMYNRHIAFLDWARAYDSGGIGMRSRAEHDEWQKLIQCPLILLDGGNDLEYNFSQIIKHISNKKFS